MKTFLLEQSGQRAANTTCSRLQSRDVEAEAVQVETRKIYRFCFHMGYFYLKSNWPKNRRDGVVVRASALQSVDLGFIPLVESYRKTLKNGIYSFPAWRSAFKGGC